MWTPLRRFLGVAGLAFCGLAACEMRHPDATATPPTESPEAPASPVEPAPPLPHQAPPQQPPPPVQEETACPRLPTGLLPSEALEAVSPSIQLRCDLFPASCAPEALRPRPEGAATCNVHDRYSGTTPTFSMEFDAQGRVVDFQGQMDWSEHYTYDACGRLAARSSKPAGSMMARGSKWEFGPDGRLLEHTAWFGNMDTVTRYTYGPAGELLGAEASDHYGTYSWPVGRWTYTHDTQGRIIRGEQVELLTGGQSRVDRIEVRTYADSGELSELRMTYPGDMSGWVKSFSEGRPVYEKHFTSNSSRETRWTYLPNGLPEKVRYDSQEGGEDGGYLEEVFRYDEAWRLIRQETTSVRREPDGTESRSQSMDVYTRDADGRLRSTLYLNQAGETVWDRQYQGNCY